MLLTERRTQQGLLVTVCDGDLLGETFEGEGDVSLTVSEEFYGGDSAEEREVLESLGRATVANLVGDRAVAVAVEAGYVDPENVLELEGTRHAQFLRMG
jgi:hypothetical protein